MAYSLRDIKRRMRSVKNTGQITRAMEAVAATKMRRAQQVALAARPYAVKALELLSRVSEKTELTHWLLEQRPERRITVMLVTSDKGLCGVLNMNVLRMFERFAAEHREMFEGGKCDIVALGRYGARYARRRGYGIAREYEGVGDYATLEQSKPVSDFLLEQYRAKQCDAAYVLYTDFISTLKQSAVIKKMLPLSKEQLEEIAAGVNTKNQKPTLRENSGSAFSYIYMLEPTPAEVLESLLPALVRVRMHQIILESNASEHSARMLAMKNASDNAEELFGELRLTYNKVRQAGITRELAEITAGAAALEE